MRRGIIASVFILWFIVGISAAQGEDNARTTSPDGSAYQWVEIAADITRPILVTHAGDGSGRLFIVSQDGQILIMQNGQVLETPFLDVSETISRDASERGLLGLAFHPDYEENGQFFINYTDLQGDTMIDRYTVSSDNPDVAAPDSATPVLHIEQPFANHNGGNIAFGPDGYLYIGTGDGGSRGDPQDNGQNPQALLGKMLRIDVNSDTYTIPADNPAMSDPSFAPEVWATGLRNPWRFSFDRATGDLYIADVGQGEYEEVNFQAAGSTGGENYGWNILEGSHPYSGDSVPDGLVNPFYEYSHGNGCSVTGGYVYRGELLPDLQGVYLFGDYCSGVVWASYRDADNNWQTNEFMETRQRISSFGEDEAGELYLVDHVGTIFQLAAA
jgi:glucose/arabinose dehydrogenase